MDENVYIAELLDCYRGLLTEKQADIMSLHFEEDLSLAEITDHYDITRQAVLDNIKRAVRQLESYESKLGLVRINSERNRKIADIIKLCDKIGDKQIAGQIADSLKKLED